MLTVKLRQVNHPCWMEWVRSNASHAGAIRAVRPMGSARSKASLLRRQSKNAAMHKITTSTAGHNSPRWLNVSPTKRKMFPQLSSMPCQVSAVVRTPAWWMASPMISCPVIRVASTHFRPQHMA